MKILSIFLTVDGECNWWQQGSMSVFIRTSGCSDILCDWCDTKYSWPTKYGKDMGPNAIMKEIARIGKGVTKVTITGGEPLQQPEKELRKLLTLLNQAGYRVSVETSGTEPIESLRKAYPTVSWIVDYKLASAKAKRKPHMQNYALLSGLSWVKFVISDRSDFDEAVAVANSLKAAYRCYASIAFSPAMGTLEPAELFKWMKESEECCRLNPVLSVQLHKLIFPEDSRVEEDGELDVDYSRRKGSLIEGAKYRDPKDDDSFNLEP